MNYYYEIFQSTVINYFNNYKFRSNINNINYLIKNIRLKNKGFKKKIFNYSKSNLSKPSFSTREKRLKVRSRKLITKMILSKKMNRFDKKSYRIKKSYFFNKKIGCSILDH